MNWVRDKNIFKKLKLFKMIFEAEMPLFFLIKYRKNKEKRERELPNSVLYATYICLHFNYTLCYKKSQQF